MSEIRYKTIEHISIGFVLFLFVGALPFSIYLFDLVPGQEVPKETRLLLRIFWSLAYIPTTILFFFKWRETCSQLIKNPLLLILVIVPLLSVLWSILPEDTFRRSIGLVFTTIFGLVLAIRCTRTELLYYLAYVLTIVMVLCVLFGLLIPDWGRMMYEGELSWRGVFSHKNGMGEIMLLYIIVLVYLFPTSLSNRVYSILGIGFALMLLFLSRSMTPVLGGFALIILVSIFLIAPVKKSFVGPWFILCVLWGCLGLYFSLTNLEQILGLFNRDMSLTGRDAVWKLVWEQIESHFLFGFGYQAFWLDVNGQVSYLWEDLDWKMSSAHNGFLELWLDLGVVGVVIFMLVFGRAVFQAFVCAMQKSTWPLTFLTFFFLLNLSESRILEQNNLYWVLFVAISSQLSNSSAEESNRRHFPIRKNSLYDSLHQGESGYTCN